jgi:hypothetical protein
MRVYLYRNGRKKSVVDKNIATTKKAASDIVLVHFFSSVAHVWVPGAKTTGPIVKKFVFS